MSKVQLITITAEQVGQRIDNFLINQLKGLPKARIYRAIRKGEVRVNRGRIKQSYRIQENDEIRVPPLKLPERNLLNLCPSPRLQQMIEQRIIYEDGNLLVIDKPAGMPVHGGTQVSAGLIEILREIRPKSKFLELVHRLDRETSGCLLIAKKRSTLVELHRQLTNRELKKAYLLLVQGAWQGGEKKVVAALRKNVLSSGERIVKVCEAEGKSATTFFKPLHRFKEATLLLARPITGRTHQIRVHAASIGHPIACDEKYGNAEFDKRMRQFGLKRLFLHSASLEYHTEKEGYYGICAILNEDLRNFLSKIK